MYIRKPHLLCSALSYLLTSSRPELAPTKEEVASPSYWRLDGTIAQVSCANNKEIYSEVHDRAIKQRQAAASGEVPIDMKRLYKFWQHFLTAHFNPGMYKEFQRFAVEDANAQVPSKVGLDNLLQFYKSVLSNNQPGLWQSEHPIYKVLQAHFNEAKSIAGGEDQI